MATAVSSSTTNFGGNTDQARRTLASAGGVLYTVNDGGSYLESLNVSTGVATRVGSSTRFGQTESGAQGLAAVGSTLYMVGSGGTIARKLYTVSTTTGAATLVRAVTGAADLDSPRGLAGGYTQPADMSVASATGAITYGGSSAPAGVYTLYVRARDGKAADGTDSTAWDAVAPVTVTVGLTVAPGKPTGASATAGNGTVRLAATVTLPAGTSLERWEYQYKTGAGQYGTWQSVADTDGTLSHDVTVANGATYTFKVRAVNSIGNGAASDELAVTLAAAAPPTPVLTAAAGAEKVTLSTAALASGTPIQKWQYRSKTTGAYGEWTDIALHQPHAQP